MSILFFVISFLSAGELQGEYAWQQIFDGKTLTDWSVPVFGGDGEVKVKDGHLVIGQGAMITGVKYEKVFPRVNYEIRYEAKRTMGNDFFAALTFPVGDSCCTFINGGWGGGTIGLSCVDSMDASENETSSFFSFSDNQWYKFRIFVTGTLIRVWIDEPTKDGKRKETLVIDLKIGEKKISLRDETSQYQPLGFCTWVSEGNIRNIEYRKLKPEEVK
ncbi:MAG: DUF1080 domain-containing protein [Planctomycetaceae bacterium]|jgi:hypothetical protein|nr:DUF1080 domain-containing protein [Planctomycetaceae bacterium]